MIFFFSTSWIWNNRASSDFVVKQKNKSKHSCDLCWAAPCLPSTSVQLTEVALKQRSLGEKGRKRDDGNTMWVGFLVMCEGVVTFHVKPDTSSEIRPGRRHTVHECTYTHSNTH